MQQRSDDRVNSINRQPSQEWTKLIRKLRWIGMENEARRLEQALSDLPPEERRVLVEPLGTD